MKSPETPSQPFALNGDPTKSKKKRGVADSRHVRFMELLFRAHKHFVGIEPVLNGVAGKMLSDLLKSCPNLDEKTWCKWLTNYHESSDHNPACIPTFYLHKLPNYALGTMNKFGRPNER